MVNRWTPSTPIPTSSSFVIVCTDGRVIVESANKGMKVFGMGQFDISVTVELVVLLSDHFTLFPKSWA